MPAEQAQSFSSRFNSRFSFGTDGNLTGRFGLNVLDDLITGIDDYMAASAAGRQSVHYLGPAMLGAFMWLDDPELLKRIAECPHACVAFTKQERPFGQAKLARLRDTLNRCPGFPAYALPELGTLALRDASGRPLVVGPSTSLPNLTIHCLRTVGYRKTHGRLVPLLHAKMVLLGDLRWHDEDELGYPTETLDFSPRRLWIGSANGTTASRLSLEFGCWQTEPELLRQAQQFLTQVIAHSEDIDPDSDNMEPDLVEVEFDDEAMIEALALAGEYWDEDGEV